jgi:hypothetical protein
VEGVVRIGRGHEAPPPDGQQIVLAQDAAHPLHSDHKAFALQHGRHAAVAVEAMRQGGALHGGAQGHLRRSRFVALPVAVKAGATDLRQLAQTLDAQFALRVAPAADLGEDAVAPGLALCGRDASILRKAALKKRVSKLAWPNWVSSAATRDSNSRMR